MDSPQRQRRKTLPSALLRLDRFWIESLNLTFKPSEKAVPAGEISLLGQSEFAEVDSGFLVRLNVRSRAARKHPVPLRFEMTISGHFTLPEEVPQDQRRRLVSVSGSAMLYSVARAVLAMVAGAGYSPFQLPSVNFINFLEDRDQTGDERSPGSNGPEARRSPTPHPSPS